MKNLKYKSHTNVAKVADDVMKNGILLGCHQGLTFKELNYISKTSDPQTRNFTIQVEVDNTNNSILSGLSTEIEINLDAENAFFVSSSLITLNDLGEIGLKIISSGIVQFIPIKIISDTGKGYWIKTINKDLSDEIIVITQGHEYTIEGEIVDFSFKKND